MRMGLEHQPDGFREALVTWFEEVREDFPWRRTTDPWAILVSEVMLQQTQVATVLGKGFYVNFMGRFPDVQSIAVASEQEILKAWEGLGYYRRVRNLQKTAQAIVAEYGGVFPQSHAEVLALPGVGPYTAGAVCSFAYHQAQPLVDANVARVFARLFNYHTRVDSTAGTKQLWSWADTLLDRENPAAYNSALMELGQKICKNKNPLCEQCPVRNFCLAEEPEVLPKKKERKKTVEVLEQCVWHQKDGKVLLSQQPSSGRREGMWALPLLQVKTRKKPIYKANYAITHHKVDLRVYQVDTYQESENDRWVEMEELENYPTPSPFRKALQAIAAGS